jgi:hypothetical protein
MRGRRMSDSDDRFLAEVKGRAEAATPGTYVLWTGFNRMKAAPSCYGTYLEVGEQSTLITQLSTADAEFIAQSRTFSDQQNRALRVAVEFLDSPRECLCVAFAAGQKCPNCEAITRIQAILNEGDGK